MKRFFAIFLAAAMLFTFCVSAGAQGLDFLAKDYSNYSMTSTIKVTLNEPLEILSVLADLEVNNQYDYQRIVESLLGSTITIKADCDASEDLLSAKMYMECAVNAPIEFSDDLSIAADAKIKYWFEYDLSDAENPKFVYVYTNPLKTDQYFVMDLSSQLVGQEIDMTQTNALMGDIMILRSTLLEAIQSNATITQDGNKTTLAMTGENVIDIIFDALKIISDTYGENAQYLTGYRLTGAEMPSNLEIEAARAFAKTLKIFGEDAMTQTYTTDDDGYVTTTEQKIHIDLNVYDLLKAFDLDGADLYPLTAENSNVDLTIEIVSEYDKIGTAEVTMPILTEENSIDLVNPPRQEYISSDDPDYWTNQKYFYTRADGELVDRNNPSAGMFVDIDEFFDYASNGFDNLVYTSSYDTDSKTLTIVYSSDYIDETTLVMTAGSNTYYVNGEARTAVLEAKEYLRHNYVITQDREQALLVDMGIVGSLFGCKLDEVSVYYEVNDDGTMSVWERCWFLRKNPAYVGE